jgi:hypothetical protein
MLCEERTTLKSRRFEAGIPTIVTFQYDIVTFQYDIITFQYDIVTFQYDIVMFQYDIVTFHNVSIWYGILQSKT